MSSLTLRHLTLSPTNLNDIPSDTRSPESLKFQLELVKEAIELLENESWKEKKSHHGGLVETMGLPVDLVKYETSENGGNGSTKSPTGSPDGEGIQWHKRESLLKVSEYGGFDEWMSAMGDRHTEQEREYVDSLKELIDIGEEEGKEGCFLKLYKLPFGATDRSFMCHTLVVKPPSSETDDDDSNDDDKKKKSKSDDENSPDDAETASSQLSSKPGSRSFFSFSLPITIDSPHPAEKKYVRGTTCTVERIMECDDGKTINWTCASLSSPGGSIPVKLGESKMAASLADAVPPILKWIKKAHPPGSGQTGGGRTTVVGTRGGGMKDAVSKDPVAARITKKDLHPGGAMGLMPTGRFTLEMFQRPVKLRDF